MSRTVISTAFDKKLTSLTNIKAKIDADGVDGPLVEMLASKGIDLVADTAKGVVALGYHTAFQALRKTSQNLRQQGKSLMKIIIKDTTGSLQNLKSLFEPNFKSVGDWGATITDSGKFTNPTTPKGWMDLFTLIKAKNDSYVSPAVSPLLSYLVANAISLTTDATNGAAALAKQTLWEADTLASEKARQDRDTEFAPVFLHVRSIVRFLKKLYPNNVKALGEYGITVVLTPKVAKVRNLRIAFGQSKLKIKLILESIVCNTGTVALNLYKGKTISGIPIVIAPGAKWITIKGYSIVCMSNTSSTQGAQFSILPK